MKHKAILWLATWLIAGTVALAHAEDPRKSAEAGMLVTGSIEVNPNGTLHGYALDQPDKLPPVVTDVVDKTVKSWGFTLSGAGNDVVKAKMNLRVVAKPVGDGNMRVSVAGASFDAGNSSESRPSYDVHQAPHYPQDMVRARVSGTAYLLLRIGRDGTVQDVIAEQVNLDQYDTQTAMARYRKALADASLDAARQWTFHPPTAGSTVEDPYWVVRVPVNFNLHQIGTPYKKHVYGSWEAYMPGPRQTPPWISKTLANGSPDAMPDGDLGTDDARLRLNTPLGGA
jgi:hypothetical protein